MSKILLSVLLSFIAAVAEAKMPRGGERDRLVWGSKEAATNNDMLALRVMAFKAAEKPLQAWQWDEVREVIHRNPAVGWDVVRLWDLMPVRGKEKDAVTPLEKKVARGDALMSGGDFKRAIAFYRSALKDMRPQRLKFGDPDYFLYQTVVHSLARAYYGAGRFNDAIRTYRQISLIYPMPRQIQFEKMWAAVRAGHYALAVGAIASQKSSYFSRFLEPEAYLVQYYLYRRLCRKEEIKRVMADVAEFKSMLDKGTYTLEEWARRDFHSQLLYSLSKNRYRWKNSPVTDDERERERAKIRARLEKNYKQDLQRMQSEMEKVVAYLNLAPEATQKDLPKITNIPGLNKILNSRNEMWPVNDAEDWLDEVGQHVFIGRSECR